MKDDYSKLTWDDMKEDCKRERAGIEQRDVIKISTPGLGIGDNFQASSVVESLYKFYRKQVILNCYHPDLFRGNDKCAVGTAVNDPENIVLHTWSYMRQPNGGIKPNGERLSTSEQYNIRCGMWDVEPEKPVFIPTYEEIVWGATHYVKHEPYVAVQLAPDPPRKYYNVSPNLRRSDSDKRWMNCTDWYMDRWTEVVQGLTEDDGINVVQIGCEYEESIPGTIDARDVGIRNTFIVIGHSSLLIGHESFPQFAAEAMDVPSLVFITGRSCADGQYLPGRTTMDGAVGVECAPCWNKGIKNIDEYCPRTCMDNITSAMVLEAARTILDDY